MDEEKTIELLEQLGFAIVKEKELGQQLDNLLLDGDLDCAKFDSDGFRILSPREQEMNEKHWQAFKNIQKIRAEIDVLALESIGADSSDKREYVEALKEMK